MGVRVTRRTVMSITVLAVATALLQGLATSRSATAAPLSGGPATTTGTAATAAAGTHGISFGPTHCR